MRRIIFGMCIALSATSIGCVSAIQPAAIESEAQLGRVIIYRNGVAYFERYASPTQETLSLTVPTERVDDFLKSLTITDEASGEALPISYPTLDVDGGVVNMDIELPKRRGRLRINYVTESPSWKPTYRVILGESDEAKLHAWAVVDNVSGEDWKNVRVGVGSTSALSFRYDLHSVQLVERTTLSTGSALALAPPTGGSPYAVAQRNVRVLGDLSVSDLATLDGANTIVAMKEPAPTPEAAAEFDSGMFGDDDGPSDGSVAKGPGKSRPVRGHRGSGYVQQLSSKLQRSGNIIRIEGFAQAGDGDANQASLDRANVVREQLIANGVPEHRVLAVGTGVFNARQAVRVVETDEKAGMERTGGEGVEGHGGADSQEAALQDAQPLGQAHFVSQEVMTIQSEHSAMVSMLNETTQAERVFYYDPVSQRGSKKFAFNAVRIVNPSSYTLDSGPVTVYAGGQFLGEGLSEAILPGSTAFIPYALDRSILADPEVESHEEIDRLVTIQRGIVTTESRRVRRTKLTLTNRAADSATVYVRHAVAPGYTLEDNKKKLEKLGGAYLLPVEVPGGESVELSIDESTPIMKTVDIRTNGGVKAIGLFLRKTDIDAELRQQIGDVLEAHKKAANLQERIDLLHDQMSVYRQRTDEINVQLVTLKKVSQAAKLRKHLANKMEEISSKLQESTIEMSDLKGELMTLRIDLQDKLADLSLKKSEQDDGDEAAK